MRPWHLRDPVQYQKEREEVEQAYPHLHFAVQGEQISVSGSLPIEEGELVFDRFVIEIKLLTDYPASLPLVREVGGRIPRTVDRHVFPTTGTACVLLPEDRWRQWPEGSSLLAFINGPIRNYFIGQATVERGGPWPFGEWAHGIKGLLEYYQEVLGTDEPTTIRKYLKYLSAKKVKGHWDCPCGSGRRLRDCHMVLVREIREKMPRREAVKALEQFEGMSELLRKLEVSC